MNSLGAHPHRLGGEEELDPRGSHPLYHEQRLRHVPWPPATNDQREQISVLTSELLTMRSMICAEHATGLTMLYNRLDDGAFDELRSLHSELDLAVIAAYGWEAAVLGDMRERNRRLY